MMNSASPAQGAWVLPDEQRCATRGSQRGVKIESKCHNRPDYQAQMQYDPGNSSWARETLWLYRYAYSEARVKIVEAIARCMTYENIR